jgi:hypothetical protein
VGLRNEFFTAVTYGYRQGCKGYIKKGGREGYKCAFLIVAKNSMEGILHFSLEPGIST